MSVVHGPGAYPGARTLVGWPVTRPCTCTGDWTCPLSEISWRATTSGGPGGQHANRTLSRVEVQFDVGASQTLGPRQRARLLERVGPVVRASASESRSQARNRELALQRLATKLDAGLRVQPARAPTRPTKSSQVRRVDAKRRRSAIKKRRRPPGEDD